MDNQKDLLGYIGSQRWFLGVRQDASLLFYSTRQAGVRRYLKEWYGLSFETMLVPLDGKIVRVINLNKSNILHEKSKKIVIERPEILRERVEENDALWEKISKECDALISSVKAEDASESIRRFLSTTELYALNGAQFLSIFSLGLKLTELGISGTEDVLKVHDTWRNAVALKEERMGEAWYAFFRMQAKQKGVGIDPRDIMSYLSLDEITRWLLEGLEIKDVVSTRMKQGYVFLDIQGYPQQVMDQSAAIEVISGMIEPSQEKQVFQDTLKGQAAFIAETIRGKVVIVADKHDLDSKSHLMDGAILVAVQTTPHYIPYLKGVKAIITDEGGITCHAAIVSREFKIPCIVGTKFGTKVLKDGMVVEVDTKNGSITLD